MELRPARKLISYIGSIFTGQGSLPPLKASGTQKCSNKSQKGTRQLYDSKWICDYIDPGAASLASILILHGFSPSSNSAGEAPDEHGSAEHTDE